MKLYKNYTSRLSRITFKYRRARFMDHSVYDVLYTGMFNTLSGVYNCSTRLKNLLAVDWFSEYKWYKLAHQWCCIIYWYSIYTTNCGYDVLTFGAIIISKTKGIPMHHGLEDNYVTSLYIASLKFTMHTFLR